MELKLRAFFCPCCGARLDPPARRVVQCSYCDARLQSDETFIEAELPEAHKTPEPDLSQCRLSQARQGCFEMSWLHQPLVDPERDRLHFFSLGERECALVYLRICDRQGKSLDHPLPLSPLQESLQAFRDPGLAAHQALEWLCEQPQGFAHQLECAICLFDQARARVTVYSAGCSQSIYWLSNEQASVTDLAGNQGPLERKMLMETRDYFSHRSPCHLAALDSVILVSAGYAGRGDGSYASGTSALYQELREQLGEDPLRLVTLAKNAFWHQRCPAASEIQPGNSLHVVAVQARPSAPSFQPEPLPLVSLNSRRFDNALWPGADDFYELLPLHDQRWVLIWASNDGLPWSSEASQLARQAILEVLDRKDHGDNENPRLAGRQLEAVVPVTRLAVVQLLDRHRRVKYYRKGLPQPLYLAPRGQRSSSIMAFDEGGEVTLEPGSRLLFLSNHLEEGILSLEQLPPHWPGGKASHLFLTLSRLWTTPPCPEALQKVLRAIAWDQQPLGPGGYLLVTSRPESCDP